MLALPRATTFESTVVRAPYLGLMLTVGASLSVSAFYARFKERRGLTPLQYQKRLRLEAARRILFPVTSASVRSPPGWATRAASRLCG